MRRTTLQIAAAAGLPVLLLALLTILPGCSPAPPETEVRLAALEAEVKTLKAEASARDKALGEELALIRTNLGSIRSLLEADRERAGTVGPEAGGGAPEGDLDAELDAKAKGFVKENLDRLMAITRKLLDKMERELDKQETPIPPADEGDKI
ncbi:MAG: hypothetical protein V3571_08060 [Pseudodesulfovibrio sp.]